jgi:4-amino-4-deoxy-L-arabinose transferase-like glycosyltransferase
VVTPLFEAPDEVWHYPFVWHLAGGGELPIQDPAHPQLWGQEGSQPPLYYALAALLTAPFPAEDLPALLQRNPHADLGRPMPDGNINIILHTRQEDWPWRGAVLAVHLARIFSALLGTGTVWGVYALGRLLWPEQSLFAVLAAGFVAFNPMVLFIAGSVNNDNLITLLATLIVWRLTALILAPPVGKVALWGQFVLLGLLAGLAALSKVSGLGLVGLIGGTLLWWGWRRRSWGIALGGNGLVGLLAAAVAGWWYGRNWVLYGDWSGTETMVLMMGPRPVLPTWGELLAEGPGLLRSFWGVFGYFSILMPTPVYWLLNLLLGVGLVGLLVRDSWPPGLRRTWPLFVAWIGLLLMGLLRWTLRTPATQGRLLFPALATLAVLWAAGWIRLIPRRWQMLPLPAMLLLSLWVPWGVLTPAYARPPLLATVPVAAQPLAATFGGGVRLLAYEAPVTTIRPGDTLPLTLYWRGEQPLANDYSLFIHLVDEAGIIVAQRDMFHGGGLYPTGQWARGTQFADHYLLEIPRTAFAPAQAHFEVGLYLHATGERLPVFGGGDRLAFGRMTLRPHPGPVPNPQALLFEDNITLIGYTLDRRRVAPGDTLTLTLYWQGQPAHDYKVFVHLVGDQGERVAQHDSEPQEDAAPTSAWRAEETIVDEHPLSILPDALPGPYRAVVGLYDGATGRRLRLLAQDDRPVQADTVPLGGVWIGP